MDDGIERVRDPEAVKALRRQATIVVVQSLVLALVLTGVLFVV